MELSWKSETYKARIEFRTRIFSGGENDLQIHCYGSRLLSLLLHTVYSITKISF